MDIALLYFDGCPNWKIVDQRVTAIAAERAGITVSGLCCGLPALLSLGLLGAVAGISLGAWVLVALSLAAVAFAGWRRHERRRSLPPAQHEKRDHDEHEDMSVRTRVGS